MSVTHEREEEGVATEAEQITALVAGLAQEIGERAEEDLGQFLRTRLALLGELLRELRESGNVGEHQRPVE